ncbi:C4-dicarboxylate transport protein [Pseudomonas sp. M47T1]|nr:C4-dicarboxylate transport protein [Pseudomonas sp. M47T1]
MPTLFTRLPPPVHGAARVTSKVAGAVVGAGFVALAASLAVVPTVPVAAMVLMLGVDRFMAECRSLTNIIGNAVAALVVAAWDGELDRDKLAPIALKRSRKAAAAVQVSSQPH